MSLTPAYDAAEAKKKKDAIELCGKNLGPHHYIPIEWKTVHEEGMMIAVKRVTRFLCTVCFCNVTTKTFLDNYPSVSQETVDS